MPRCKMFHRWLATWLERVNNKFFEVHFKKLLYFYLVLLICCKLEESVKNEENNQHKKRCFTDRMQINRSSASMEKKLTIIMLFACLIVQLI